MRTTSIAAALVLAACTTTFPGADTMEPNAARLRQQIFEREGVMEEAREAAGLPEQEGEDPDSPDQAMAWRMLRWRDENGVIPADGLRIARAERAANVAYHESIDDAGIGRFGWVERGPFNIGGRTRSLVIDPGNPNRMWAGSVGGGIWHSTNGGASWAPVDDRLGNLAVCCLTLVPGTPHTIYAGTGEGFFNADAVVGEGIYRSLDGGATFAKLPATASWSYVNRIAVSPSNTSLLLAATRSPGGIQRSLDGGNTWTQVYATTACMQVLFDPNDGQKCVADVYDGSAHKVIRSIDGGATWTDAVSGMINQATLSGRIEMCYAASAPGMIYASCGTGAGHVWRSVDDGANWTQQSSTSMSAGAMWYYNTIWVDPTNASILVTGAYHLYRSTNGGVTRTRISNGYLDTTQPHPDMHQIVAAPGYDGSSNLRVYVTNDGGIYTATNIRTASQTSGWTRLEQNYRATQFYGAAGDGVTGRITGGTQDNGHLTLQNGASNASLTFGGDGGFAAIDWQNPNYIYGEYVYAQVHRSTNGGGSASYIDSGISEAGTAANFIAPLTLDPSDPARLYVGAVSLWRTDDARAGTVAWTNVKASIGSSISAIAVAPGNPDIVWVGHNDGRIFRTANGTNVAPTWIAVDDNAGTNPLPNRYVARIVIDHGDSNTVFVALGGFNGDNLRKTINAGGAWSDITGSGATGLPSAPINGIAQHPMLRDHLYVATEVGIFASANGGGSWSTSNDGPADVSVDEVVFLHGSTTLLAATHGRGLWTIPIREPVVAQLGTGCLGSNGVPILFVSSPRLGANVTLTCVLLRQNQFAFFAIGFSNTTGFGGPLPLDLTGFGMPGCFARVSDDVVIGVQNAAGVALGSMQIPTASSWLGVPLYVQTLGLDPGWNQFGGVVSNAVALTIGN